MPSRDPLMLHRRSALLTRSSVVSTESNHRTAIVQPIVKPMAIVCSIGFPPGFAACEISENRQA